ncbi:MAG: sigma 54-interacting transcriptional regulator [Syntrophobacterales bacterium]|nr:sigma 54-interacting transcriptional regulator [Syntrophobacterales bacterium]
MAVVLIVDDEPKQREILKMILADEGYETFTASSGEEAAKIARSYNPDVVLTDLKMKGMDGISLMSRVKTMEPEPAVVLMTAFGDVPTAVEAMKKGAFDFLTKPLDKDVVLLTIKRAVERTELLKRSAVLQKALYDKFSLEGIVGRSRAISDVITVVKKVAASPVTVLILGESGTGKELVARAIHYNSPRSGKPFTAINCAAIPETLLESELFGYEPGAFTGAAARKVGLFEASNGGTVFLDEIGDLPALTQSKILRVLQEREVRRLGGRESLKVDVRVVTATNKNLEAEMEQGRFREDLFYRLKVVTIQLPPLRERREDIPELAGYFLERYNHEFGKRIKKIDEPAIRTLQEYHWPGNIRQLESVIEKAVLMCEKDVITTADIAGELVSPKRRSVFDIDIPENGLNFEEVEKELLKKAMMKSNGVAAKAARLLGMSYKTFWYRWEKFGLKTDSPEGDRFFPSDFDIPDGGMSFEEFEKELLKKAMAKANYVVARASRLLGLSDRAFRLRWEKFGLNSSQ